MKNYSKRITLLIVGIALLIIVVSCSKGEAVSHDQISETGKAILPENWEIREPTVKALILPDSVKIICDIPSEYTTSAAIHEISFFEPDEESVLSTFFPNEKPTCTEYAEGPQYAVGDTTLLYLHTGVIRGGLNYSRWPGGQTENEQFLARNSDKDSVTKREEPTITDQLAGWDRMQSFSSEENLSFIDREELIKEISDIMEECSFPKVSIQRMLARDVNTLNTNREIYNQSGFKPIEEFSPEEEDYWIEYEQVIDGIPLATKTWHRVPDMDSSAGVLHVRYSAAYGLDSLYALNLYEDRGVLGETAIISPETAVAVFIEDYMQSLEPPDVEICGIRLQYCVNQSGDHLFLRPAWLLTIKTMGEGTFEEGGEPVPFAEYQTIAVSANTAHIMEKETDLR